MDQTSSTLQPVHTARDRREFVRIARNIYPPDLPWVQPLDALVLGHLDQQRNPFYRDGLGCAFLANRKGRTVGRILAQVWRRHHRLHAERVGYFGLFECPNDLEVAGALLGAAAEFARQQRCEVLRGPFNMTAAQEMGVMIDGFSEIPATDMVYTPPWYPSLLERAGLRPCFRMQTWRNGDLSQLDPDALAGNRASHLKAFGIQVRPFDVRRRAADLEHVRELINAAFLGNWAFVPITREEWEFQMNPLIPILDLSLILFAETQGVPVGVTFAAPDFNQVLCRMAGKLFHPAVVSLFRRPSIGSAVIILYAVRKQFHGMGVSRLLNAELVRALRRRGYRSLAITWIGEENSASRAQAEALQMRRAHDLAMYEQKL